MQKLTPMMQQYMEIKEKNKDSILFFRLGDFYEMFFDDAILASKELEIVLTGKDCGLEERAPMCGVPFHSAENYIAKLISKGYRVAICEQVEDPKEAKGIVKREIIRTITPGTVIETNMLDEKKNNYIACIFCPDKLPYQKYDSSSKEAVSSSKEAMSKYIGLAYCDVSTGKFIVTYINKNVSDISFNNSLLIDELSKYSPSEIICNEIFYQDEDIIKKLKNHFHLTVTSFNDWAFEKDFSINRLKNHFNVISLNSFGIEENTECIISSGALLEYLYQTQKTSLDHINTLKFLAKNDYMIIDNMTRRNLELTETLREKKRKGSLLHVLDKTNTSMGARMLRNWIEQPLLDSNKINYRLDGVEEIYSNMDLRDLLNKALGKIYDIERICSKISYNTVTPKDLISLKISLLQIPEIKTLLSSCTSSYLKDIYENLDTLNDIKDLLEKSINDDPPFTLKDGGIIKNGYNNLVDEYRDASNNSKQWLAELEEKEKNLTGIKNLKVGYNKVFGYYIEITKSYYDLIPDRYIRKQTLANAERLITPELKEIEEKILGSLEKLIDLEYKLFLEIRNNVSDNLVRLQKSASLIAELDSLYSLAQISYENLYVKPTVNNSSIIKIKEGRHPVIESILSDNSFVANDCNLDNNSNMVALITGPNMAGKSTFMRQVALITLMAQIGSFVPAEEATIGVVDRIFTRVGASDDLSSGQSTFMVEMTEVSNILNNATDNSLLILDEIGRGTSTFDGMSIAWAVLEYIGTNIKAKTLFSTHYHELTTLDKKLPNLTNYNILVKEIGDDIIFLRKVVPGPASSSYGIQVAKLAGIPIEVIENSKRILSDLEEKGSISIEINSINEKPDYDTVNNQALLQKSQKPKKEQNKNPFQMDIFDIEKINIINALKDLDVMSITPIEAVNKLYELWQKAKNI